MAIRLAVRLGAAMEAVAAHATLETLALGGARDVNVVVLGKDRHVVGLAYLDAFAALPELLQIAQGRQLALLEVAPLGRAQHAAGSLAIPAMLIRLLIRHGLLVTDLHRF